MIGLFSYSSNMHVNLTVFVAIFASVFWYVECACPDIISRSSWGARAPKSKQSLRRNPPPYVVVHHSDTPSCTSRSACQTRVQNIQTYHMNNKGWSDIGYNFLIGGDGSIFEGRGWGTYGSHAPGYNYRSIGICLIGNYQNAAPPSVQLETLKSLINCAVETSKVASDYHIIGHRQAGTTSCPGTYLYNEVKNLPRWDAHPN